MSPLGKAKGLAIMIGSPGGGEEGDEELTEDKALEGIASAIKEGDGEGAAQAIAAYVDACMTKKEPMGSEKEA